MAAESQLRMKLNQKLIESGEKERIKDVLRQRLTECGWKDQLKSHCLTLLKSKSTAAAQNTAQGNSSSVSVEELVAELTPSARLTVPESIKREVTERILKFIETNDLS